MHDTGNNVFLPSLALLVAEFLFFFDLAPKPGRLFFLFLSVFGVACCLSAFACVRFEVYTNRVLMN